MRYSEQNAYNNCPSKYKLIHIDKLRRVYNAEQENDKVFGQAIHAALQVHYQGKSANDVFKEFTRLYPKSMQEDDAAKSFEGGIKALEAYIKHYEDQDKMWEVMATEEAGVIEFGGQEHEVHIDLIAKHRQTNEVWFWDHKTAYKATAMTAKKYEMSAQMTRYTVWVQRKYGSCAGGVINLIVLGHRKRAYMGEPSGYWQKFERIVINRTPQQIDLWLKSDQAWLKQIELSKEHDNWPLHLSDLCGWCEFYEYCLSGQDEQIKDMLYTNEQPETTLSEFKPEIEV